MQRRRCWKGGALRAVNVIFFVLIAIALPVSSIANDIEAFYGQYAGSGYAAGKDGKIGGRDLSVEIQPGKKPKSFIVAWSTVTHRPGGGQKSKGYRIRFVPTGTKNVYSSAMRINVFGRAVPLDPLKGDPYVWAVVAGPTLKVNALIVTKEFGYEMQTYTRTLTKGGLDLHFTRVRDGTRLRDVRAELVRRPQ